MASDITIICPNQRQLLCHRAVLASRSKRLAAVFNSGEYTGQHLPVSGVDSAALEAVVSSFYTGECPVSLDTVCAVHDAALKLEVPDLLLSCETYVKQALNMDNVVTLFLQASQFKDAPILDICRSCMYNNLPQLADTRDFPNLPYDTILAILADAQAYQVHNLHILQLAASWLSRQPSRDSLKLTLLTALGANHGSMATLDQLMDQLSRQHMSATSLNMGVMGVDHMGATTPNRLSVGNLVMPPHRESLTGARLLGNGMNGAGMGMGGGLESPLGGMQGHSMMGMGSNALMGGMFGSQQLVIQNPNQQGYGMAGENQAGPFHQVHYVNGQPVSVANTAVQQLQNQGVRGSPQAGDGMNGSPASAKARQGRNNVNTPPSRKKSGKRPNVPGRKMTAAEGSEDDHSEATRSMPTGNDPSDGERESTGAPAPQGRRSWYGTGQGDGVLTLAQAAEVAEKAKVKLEGGGTPPGGRRAEVVGESAHPAHSNNSSRKQGGDAGDDAAGPERGTPSKRSRLDNTSHANDGQSQPLPQSVLTSTGQLLSGNGNLLNGANGSYSINPQAMSSLAALSNLGNPGAGGGFMDPLQALGNLGNAGNLGSMGNLDQIMPGNFLSSLTSSLNPLNTALLGGNLQGLLDGTNIKSERVEPSGGGRGKGGRGGSQPAKGFCHVDNCGADLTGLRDYHQRYKICDMHLKAPSIMREGTPQRFCQQCGRFHQLDAFDGTRRSCRAMLQRHNARRNKRNPDNLPLPVQDGPRGMQMQAMQSLQNLSSLPAANTGLGAWSGASGTGLSQETANVLLSTSLAQLMQGDVNMSNLIGNLTGNLGNASGGGDAAANPQGA